MKNILIIAFFACVATFAIAGEEKAATAKKACCAEMAKSEAGCTEKTVATKAEAKVTVAQTATAKAATAKTAKPCEGKAVTAKTATTAKAKSCCADKSDET